MHGLYGAVSVAGPRSSYPLGFHHTARITAPRLALVGDAAHGIHPIAGQGLNLGLRDVGALVEVIAEGRRLGLDPGDAQPNAVRTVIEVSRDPITIDRLVARLDGLAPTLATAPPEEGALGWLSRELGELFVVRREDSPSPEPMRRLERARLFLQSGRAQAAASEVRNLPNAAGAADWIADAERYAAAQRALELLETAALLEPRSLRDGSGRSVEQVSPVAGD